MHDVSMTLTMFDEDTLQTFTRQQLDDRLVELEMYRTGNDTARRNLTDMFERDMANLTNEMEIIIHQEQMTIDEIERREGTQDVQ